MVLLIAPSPIHSTLPNSTPPSSVPKTISSPLRHSCRSNNSTRNTVHWDNFHLDPSIKETTAPEAQNYSPTVKASGSLRVVRQPGDVHLDLGNRKLRGQQRRPPLVAETFIAPDTSTESVDTPSTDQDPCGDHGLVQAARRLDPNENVFEKHRKKHFQWVLSLPSSASSNPDQPLDKPCDSKAHSIPAQGERRYFGCNLLTWTNSAGKEKRVPGDPEDKYLLLATPIDLKPSHASTTNLEFTTHQFRIIQQDTRNMDAAAAQMMSTPSSAASYETRSATWSTAPEASENDDKTLTIDPRCTEMRAPLSTIEDSIEELDQLEEEVEAIAAATQSTLMVNHGENRSRDEAQRHSPSLKTPSNRDSSTSKPAPKARASVRSKASESLRRGSVRKPSSLIEAEQDSDKTPAKAATPRKVPRPASLAPPKPFQKASKPLTVPTFELPGEKVARELKEKKAARLSMQADSQKVAEAGSPPQRTRSIRSSKPPTVPNFELPGEAHSRMKKERLALRLKQEEEEVRKRREFKARPPPSSVAGTVRSTVRSTFTSRQRECNAGNSDQQGKNVSSPNSSPRSGAAKRQPATMTHSMARTVSNASASTVSTTAQTTRGRTSSLGSSHDGGVSTRATSSSNGSIVSGVSSMVRSSVSMEEAQQQKVRGWEIYRRDNSLAMNKEQQKREREQAIKLARQKYAEQSRMLAASSRARRMQQQSQSSSS